MIFPAQAAIEWLAPAEWLQTCCMYGIKQQRDLLGLRPIRLCFVWRLLNKPVCKHGLNSTERANIFWACLMFAGMWFIMPGAPGQSIDFRDNRVAMADLAGPWRFHTEDNPAWADPSLPDSDWHLLYAGKSWDEQGYKGYSGIAWYRIRVLDLTDRAPLALYMPSVDDSYQVFVNGRLIGHVGDLPPNAHYVFAQRMYFTIPADIVQPHQGIEIAVRVWHPPRSFSTGGGLISVPRIGSAPLIAQWRRFGVHDRWTEISIGLIHLHGNLLTCVAGFLLFFLRRKEREYLWWGFAQLFYSLYDGIGVYAAFRPVPSTGFLWCALVFYLLANYFWLAFYVAFLRQPRNWLFWCAVSNLLLAGSAFCLWIYRPDNLFAGVVYSFGNVLWNACVVGLLWRGARRGNSDATFLLIPMSLVFAVGVMSTAAGILAKSGIPSVLAVAKFLQEPIHWPFTIHGDDIAILVNYAVLFVLVRRYARSRRDEERLVSELEAARAVQKVLIPNEVPSVGGFAVETVYNPAAQVGGDFFQIIPLARGGAVVAIGDVSGKGMPAAMTVSLIVGTLRTLVDYTQAPCEILSALNRRLMARSQGGFTTCLVLRLDADGTLTAANAGHIAPYLDGHEIEVENGLPLGIAETVEYRETTIRLEPGGRLTLLTDGVVEARNSQGDLLGFERTRELSTHPAREVAMAAQSFGQEDDITVLSVCMTPADMAA